MQQAQNNEQNTSQAITLATLPDLPTPADMQALLGVSEAGFNSLVKAGAIPAPVVNSGRIRRWNKAQVVAALGGAV
jgi:predicted DNA-binding transcriptional regulator AlpA